MMLETFNLTKRYRNGVLAVSDLNLKVEKGEVYVMLGANGAGKTTTINLILILIEPTAGQVFVNGINVVKNPLVAKQRMAYVSENVMLYENMSAYQNLAFFSELAGKKPVSGQAIEAVLKRVGLQEKEYRRKLKTYSKGMRQKCGIAIAILKEADLILLDEPTSGLDPKSGKEFLNLIHELKNEGKTIFMTTHDLFRAKKIADKIGIMKSGKLLQEMGRAEMDAIDLEEIYLKFMENAN